MSENNTKTPPKKKTKVNKKIKVAIFCLTAIVIFYFGANFLKGIDIFGKKSYYYAVFEDIGPLSPSSTVTLNGYKVGKITKIDLQNDNPVKICVEIFINEDVSIPEDSYFEVIKKDILSTAVMDIRMGSSKTMAQNKDTLTAIIADDKLNSILNNIDGTLVSVNTIAEKVSKDLVEDGGLDKIKNAIDKFENTMDNIDDLVEEKKPEINRMIENITIFSNTLKKISPDLDMLIDNFNDLGDTAKIKVATLLTQVEATMEQVNTFIYKLNNGDGNVDQLLNDKTLYNNITSASQNLDKLLIDLKENPGRYIHISVFGNKDKKDKNK
ncbi:MlaD family protein [Bacteroidales bacterium OttesenSCG-928-B11]|nr:MlaD family protein [Bacteroidales bacterium OttesenSCG-928-E04]MDL2308570.1 MlaD family protein [Bacteroidales bacterium OttesenSCG-928-C03]MDL2312858.1 MlaD family protein [Bacteroidales bacterium OttesenSCG-928-B11]MDL2325860.1 MlaD family protein [Bacteroidales bacterium OttesenSCG-928-A14]